MPYGYTDSAIYAGIASAIREARGTSDLLYPSQMADAIRALAISGDPTTEDYVRALAAMPYGQITVSGPYSALAASAFACIQAIVAVDLPACGTLADEAFADCTSLVSVGLPACTTLGKGAFAYCSALSTVDLPACTSVGSYAFASCSSLTTVSLPVCTTVGSHAFAYCSALSTVDLPACTTVGSNAFYGCSRLASVSLPACKYVGSRAFQSCRSLVSLYLASVSSVPTLGSSAFYFTPIGGYSYDAGQYGSVFVPSSLVNSFKTATNWASVSSRIVGV